MKKSNHWHIHQKQDTGYWYFDSIEGAYEIGPYRNRKTCEQAIPIYQQYLNGKMDFGEFLIRSEVIIKWD